MTTTGWPKSVFSDRPNGWKLIEGEIVQMSRIGSRHAGCVNCAGHLFNVRFAGKVTVTVQNPVRLNQYNEPEPDVVLARFRSDYYASGHPTPEDILLIVEVSDTTLRIRQEYI